MKTYLVLVLSIAATSCQKPKDWECTCEYNSLSNGSGIKTATIKNEKKRDALEKCTDYGKRLIAGNGKYKCSIK